MQDTRKPARSWLKRLASLAAIVVVAACTTPTPPVAPTISSFSASPASITAGESSELSWTVTGSDVTIVINDGTSDVYTSPLLTGQFTVSPAVTTTYTLTATNSAGSDSEPAVVTVTSAPGSPEIVAFTADPTDIDSGDSSELSWEVAGEDVSIVINDGASDVHTTSSLSGEFVVSPTVTTTYTLTASNSAGSDSETAVVTVTAPVAAPEVVSFGADPDDIETGDNSELSWTVTGADVTIVINDGTTDVHTTNTLTGQFTVSPAVTTTYTLTATNAGGSDDGTATVTVTEPNPDAPSISALTAALVLGSQVDLQWTVANATAVEVRAAQSSAPGAPSTLITTLGGTATSFTAPIPASNRQTIRVCATGPGGEDCDTVPLSNVVVSPADYDPYHLEGHTPEPAIPGTLRFLLANAAPGAVIGFASDITEVVVDGVDLENIVALGGFQDAHLILRNDVVISGPASGVTLRAESAFEAGDPGDPFTYRSRVIFVPPDVEAHLDNLTITGGTFIFNGGGIRNNGTLTVTNSVVTGNRAWNIGGGIWNAPTGVLTVTDSVISDNRAVTEISETGQKYAIRGGFVICMIRSGYGGGLFNSAGGQATVTGTDFIDNEAMISGGAIYNDSSLSLSEVIIDGNAADHTVYTGDPSYPPPPDFVGDPDCPEFLGPFDPYSLGGGIYNGVNAVLTHNQGSLLENHADGAGGGLFVHHQSDSAILSNLLIDFNSAQFGGGIQHEHFTGDPSNLTLNTVSFGTNGNVPENILVNEIDPPGGLRAPGTVAERGVYVAPEGLHNR